MLPVWIYASTAHQLFRNEKKNSKKTPKLKVLKGASFLNPVIEKDNLIASYFQVLNDINESLRRYSKILRLFFRCYHYAKAGHIKETDTHRPFVKLKL